MSEVQLLVQPAVAQRLADEDLAKLSQLDVTQACLTLAHTQRITDTTVEHLANVALHEAEANPEAARHWLDIGLALLQQLGPSPLLRAQLDYAQARLYVVTGNLPLAETALRAAQTAWQRSGDQIALARSHLGLTQVLAMQGRYDEAALVGQQAIAALQTAARADATLLPKLANAYLNLATLLVYQEKHAVALDAYAQARHILEQRLVDCQDQPAMLPALQQELAIVQTDEATALMFLNRVDEAEAALQQAIATLDQVADQLNGGRARTNLGSLYLRTGRYAAALQQFKQAAQALLHDTTGSEAATLEQLRKADMLLLDQANAYLALNLLPEAMDGLQRCERLFRAADMPYELGQTLLTLGMLRLRANEEALAETALLEAEAWFDKLQNPFWLNRTRVALAALDEQRHQPDQAARRLDALLAQAPLDMASMPAWANAIHWDVGSWVEAQLMRLRLHLARQEVTAARAVATAIARALGAPMPEPSAIGTMPHHTVWPQFYLRLQHALGEISQATGDQARAQRYFRTALTLLEHQRASLPLEEIRTALLDDKSTLYSDLVRSLLDEATPTAQTEAFAVVERARSRALLERLLTTLSNMDAKTAHPLVSGHLPTADPLAARRNEIQQQLHWLYNRLAGDPGSHRPGAGQAEPGRSSTTIADEIRAHELALQQLEWQSAPQLGQAQPVDLATLQQTLAADQQALVYYMTQTEVMAFLVSPFTFQVFRRLCTVAQLQAAQTEWRFQLGRAEMGRDYFARHAERFQQAARGPLLQLYQLLIAPLAPSLHATRLLFIPYGSLHLLPFHALWDGQDFLVERYICTYAPSASLAVHTQRQAQSQQSAKTRPLSWAGVAIDDPTIPAARQEVEAAARYFAKSWLYLDKAANRASLQMAARQADVLHIATHGLFRLDNPFFSVLKLADGWVDVRDIYRLPLRARLVILSACASGAGQVQGGDEVIGLARGFLGAGAQALVVSLWNVHDASSARFMADFYAALTRDTTSVPWHGPAPALRAAQLAAIRQGQHPYYWAPFFVIGDCP